MRRMWLQVADAKRKRLITPFPDELRCLISEEGGLRERFFQPRRHVTRKDLCAPVFHIRLKAVFHKELVIRAELKQTCRIRKRMPVRILATHPGVKAVLRENLIAQVPFAHVGAVVFVGKILGYGRHIGRQRYVAGGHPGGVGPQASQHGCPRRAAHRLAYVGVLEHKTLFGQPVEGRRLNLIIAVAPECVGALMVCENVEQVGSGHLITGLKGLSSLPRRNSTTIACQPCTAE